MHLVKRKFNFHKNHFTARPSGIVEETILPYLQRVITKKMSRICVYVIKKNRNCNSCAAKIFMLRRDTSKHLYFHERFILCIKKSDTMFCR